jgi:hypothetical protein
MGQSERLPMVARSGFFVQELKGPIHRKFHRTQFTCVTNFPKYNEVLGEPEEVQLLEALETGQRHLNREFDTGKGNAVSSTGEEKTD